MGIKLFVDQQHQSRHPPPPSLIIPHPVAVAQVGLTWPWLWWHQLTASAVHFATLRNKVLRTFLLRVGVACAGVRYRCYEGWSYNPRRGLEVQPEYRGMVLDFYRGLKNVEQE
jgi:hypothetical protein